MQYWSFFINTKNIVCFSYFKQQEFCDLATNCVRLLWPHGLWPVRFCCSWHFSRQEYWSGLPFPYPVWRRNFNIVYLTIYTKRCPFHYRDWNVNVRNTEILRVTGRFRLRVKNEAEQMLTEFCQENTLVIANTCFQEHKRRPCTWTSPNGQYQNQIVYILCSWRWRSAIQSAKMRPGADCGSDHELLIA